MIWIYDFEDGTTLKLIDIAFSTEELWALKELHGNVCITPDIHVCLHEHCAAFVEKYSGSTTAKREKAAGEKIREQKCKQETT